MPDEVKNDSVTIPETKPEKLFVDLEEGVRVEMSYEDGKKYIEKRDKNLKRNKELADKISQIEKEKLQAIEKAKLLELSKNNHWEELKQEASKEYREKLDKVSSRIVRKELESALLASDDFIKDFKDDAVKLLQMDFQFSLDENMEKVVGSDGKEVSEIVKEWIGKKDIFRKAKGTSGTGAKVGPGTPQVANSGFDKFVDKLIKKH